MGVPLINAIYENNPLVGLYTLPLLIWHPMQLVVGSFLAPKLYQWVQAEKERLGIDDNEEKEATTKDEEVVPLEESPLKDEPTISDCASWPLIHIGRCRRRTSSSRRWVSLPYQENAQI